MRVFVLSFLVLVTAPAADAKSKKRPLAGTWSLELERPARWDPRICKGTLVLERDGRKWGGRIRFERILYARSVPLIPHLAFPHGRPDLVPNRTPLVRFLARHLVEVGRLEDERIDPVIEPLPVLPLLQVTWAWPQALN